MLYLGLLEDDKYVVKFVDERVMVLHPFLVHLELSVMFIEELVMSFMHGFKSLRPTRLLDVTGVNGGVGL